MVGQIASPSRNHHSLLFILTKEREMLNLIAYSQNQISQVCFYDFFHTHTDFLKMFYVNHKQKDSFQGTLLLCQF